ncbi:hypothetical protein [Streptomyces yaizuensis]|uniref:Uncharacterized protein n=1 Tax=Streptomyces yaizuensis TaxID=2989713 RepID=A0ABQ5PBM6_9ACTN|nr:hypothetical protein [Streptomyces sp. YSPA8]GLF99923.1 hypothetical protein SYYSPA8_36520 [Streptomyces sp. YSPA8]
MSLAQSPAAFPDQKEHVIAPRSPKEIRVPLFLLGLVLGALSGGVTYLLTDNQEISAFFAAIAAVLTWLRIHTVIFGSAD